ncbi:hypothetical protein LWE61_01015 [Sphingobium sufflavum]|nr:hypothetical protein [Sphingobium sufflavum]
MSPLEQKTEILDILQSLGRVWPHSRVMTWPNLPASGMQQEPTNHYVAALQWLTDMGMVTFEALSITGMMLSVHQAALTSQGRDYLHSLLGSVAVDRVEG